MWTNRTTILISRKIRDSMKYITIVYQKLLTIIGDDRDLELLKEIKYILYSKITPENT